MFTNQMISMSLDLGPFHLKSSSSLSPTAPSYKFGEIPTSCLYHVNKLLLYAYTPCPEKKGATLFLPVTPRHANRFSKFFHYHALQ